MKNKINTCGNCPHVKITSTMRGQMFMASCGKTEEGYLVPHEWFGEKVTCTRVPEFCTNPDAKPSKKPAPRKDWVVIDVSEYK